MPKENEMRKILEELLFKACLKCPDEDNDDGLIQTALARLKEEMMKCAGKELDIKDHHQECYRDCHRCIEILAINLNITETKAKIERMF